MFIVFEGIDGCGKSTQARMLAEWLGKEGSQVVATAEPTKNRMGLFLREILSGREKVDPKTLALLFTADRCEHLERVVEPALSEGRIVLSERYYHSTIAYQSAQGVDAEWLFDINSFARKPDLAIFLDVRPKDAIKRKKCEEIFENGIFLEKVYAEYMRFDEMIKVDGTGGMDAVHERIKRIVSNFPTKNQK